MGKKMLALCLDVIMIAFSSLILEIWSFTVYFSGKRRALLHPNTAQGSFFPLQSFSAKTPLLEKSRVRRPQWCGEPLLTGCGIG